MADRFEMTPREAVMVEASIVQHFGICRLDDQGNFKGAADPRRNWDGMEYGYLVREGHAILVVDRTPDEGDRIVDRIGA